ncbi:hypothetical protein ABVV53_02005 [Novosphingobium sp. RD2P27]|uniref:Uncharacterized protein n=1 Tax=Novosphingobium kalidii TaxID=3230299 RepID=A0ABV2CYL0_9SPHN
MDPISSYRDFTEALKAFTGMSPQMLHVHAGMAIYLASQLLLGSRRASWVALLVVLEIELFNEVMNYLFYGSWRWADTLSDIAFTLFWPTMCVSVGKYRRWRWARRRMVQALTASQLTVPASA